MISLKLAPSAVLQYLGGGDLIHAANLDMLNAYPWRYTRPSD